MAPLPLCSPSSLPLCAPKMLPFYFLIIICICTFSLTFYPISMPPFILYTRPALWTLIFAFLDHFSHTPATSIFPHQCTSITIIFQGSLPPSWPIPSPSPCLPPCSHFCFFGRFMNTLFLSHFIYTCTYIIISIEKSEFYH